MSGMHALSYSILPISSLSTSHPSRALLIPPSHNGSYTVNEIISRPKETGEEGEGVKFSIVSLTRPYILQTRPYLTNVGGRLRDARRRHSTPGEEREGPGKNINWNREVNGYLLN